MLEANMESSLYKTNITPHDKDLFKRELLDINHKMDELSKKLSSMKNSVDSCETKYGLSYLDSKSMMLASYMGYIFDFISDKLNGEKPNEETLRQLVTLKVTQEKMRVIDLKLKPQLNKIMNTTVKDSTADVAYKPLLLEQSDDEEEEQEEEKVPDKSAKFKVNKRYMDYHETTSDRKKNKKKFDKTREDMKSTEYYQELKEEFTNEPTEVRGYENTHYERFMREKEEYEDTYMTKVTVSKKQKKMLRRKDKKNEAIDNFGSDFRQLERMFSKQGEDKQDRYEKRSKLLNRKKKRGSK